MIILLILEGSLIDWIVSIEIVNSARRQEDALTSWNCQSLPAITRMKRSSDLCKGVPPHYHFRRRISVDWIRTAGVVKDHPSSELSQDCSWERQALRRHPFNWPGGKGFESSLPPTV